MSKKVTLDLTEIAAAVGGTLYGTSVAIAGVSSDSRAAQPGQLFVALKGERFDAHDFIAQVAAQGACAALIAADQLARVRAAAPNLPLVTCADTRHALGQLAAHWRAKFAIPVIALTGSNGKTTTKEMIASILAVAFGAKAVLATQGNFNNDIGLPLTLLGLTAAHKVAVIEMGMNHPGEIAYLTGLTRPTVALVTNAQRAHLEGMGSLDEVAREKGSIYAGLDAKGVAVINADDEFAGYWQGLNSGRPVRTFGLTHVADVRGAVRTHGLDLEVDLTCAEGQATVRLAVPGRHNAANALAAVAATLAAGVPLEAVAEGLARFAGVTGRLQRRAGKKGAQLLDDTYNANPDSVRAGIDVLAATIGRKVLVLGAMGEIGEMSGQFHDEVGGYAKSQGVDRLFTLGELAEVATRNFGEGAQHFGSPETLVQALLPELGPDVTVLIKGSRFMKMERVVALLADEPVQEAH